jgi:hypothetical protein
MRYVQTNASHLGLVQRLTVVDFVRVSYTRCRTLYPVRVSDLWGVRGLAPQEVDDHRPNGFVDW